MNGQQAFSTFRRKHEQLDLTTFNEVDQFVVVATRVNVLVFCKRDGARMQGFPYQRVAHLLLESVNLGLLLDHGISLSRLSAFLQSLRLELGISVPSVPHP